MIRQIYSVVNGFPFINFFVGYFVATILILRHLKKRRHWVLGMLAILAAYIAVGLLLHALGIRTTFRRSIVLVSAIFYLAMTALLLICCETTSTEALFGAMCAYAAEHLANVVAMSMEQVSSRMLGFRLDDQLTHLAVYAALYILFEFTVFRRLGQNGRLRLETKKTLISGIVLYAIVSVLYSRALIAFLQNREAWIVFFYVLMYDMLCCGFFLYVQVIQQHSARLQEDLDVERLLRKRQAEQYLITRDNIALIERKTHDLKHQIAALRSIDDPVAREKSIRDIEQATLIYGAMMKTGSDVLDTVLSDKYLYCEEHNISWTCMADGSKLDFMDPVDLYVLFANALDNAIEAVQQLQDPEQRAISVSVYTKYNMVFLQIENNYSDSIEFLDRLPHSTKQKDGYHGFGLRSIQYTVEKYGGTMQIETENQVFGLYITLPLP